MLDPGTQAIAPGMKTTHDYPPELLIDCITFGHGSMLVAISSLPVTPKVKMLKYQPFNLIK